VKKGARCQSKDSVGIRVDGWARPVTARATLTKRRKSDSDPATIVKISYTSRSRDENDYGFASGSRAFWLKLDDYDIMEAEGRRAWRGRCDTLRFGPISVQTF
jgi:hypothetical protein